MRSLKDFDWESDQWLVVSNFGFQKDPKFPSMPVWCGASLGGSLCYTYNPTLGLSGGTCLHTMSDDDQMQPQHTCDKWQVLGLHFGSKSNSHLRKGGNKFPRASVTHCPPSAGQMACRGGTNSPSLIATAANPIGRLPTASMMPSGSPVPFTSFTMLPGV